MFGKDEMAHMVQPAATYEDLKAVPPHLVAEILFGRLVTHPRPVPRHAIATNALSAVLTPPFQFAHGGPGGWIFMDEPELHLGEHVAVPDLAGWRRERMAVLPKTAWMELAPDWICEVLSPATERYDRGDKRTIYAQQGVRHLWHVDPQPQILEVFEIRDGRWLLINVFQGGEEAGAPPFSELRFSLTLLWPFDPSAATDG